MIKLTNTLSTFHLLLSFIIKLYFIINLKNSINYVVGSMSVKLVTNLEDQSGAKQKVKVKTLSIGLKLVP